MKALTISQPYASLIASGEKFVENRTWETLYRGRLAIHAGKGSQYLSRGELASYPTGCVVAVCRLVACVHLSTIRREGVSDVPVTPLQSITWKQVYEHVHTEGPFCWVLAEVLKLTTPIPWKGMQGLWDIQLPAHANPTPTSSEN